MANKNNTGGQAPAPHADAITAALMTGDLSRLSTAERLNYYRQTCESLGLNPLTKPFEYITLNGKLTLYARKDATDQLRKVHNVSITKPDITIQDDLIIVSVEARLPDGRTDADVGVVKKSDMGGNQANALMKAITKAKRRVTLSICGLGMLDETEVADIPDAHPFVENQHAPAANQLAVPPANAIAVRQAPLIDHMRALNRLGDSIKWTPAVFNEVMTELVGHAVVFADISAEDAARALDALGERLAAIEGGASEPEAPAAEGDNNDYTEIVDGLPGQG